MLLGSPSLNTIRAIPSTYHMVIKFPTANGVGIVRGNQRIARECYLASMKQKMVDNIYMDELDMRDKVSTRPAPSEELEPIQLYDQPETSGRLIKWAIELSEFDIRYKPRTTVKGQILADFIMEFTPAELVKATQLTPDLPIWKLSVDGASNAQGSGAGLILTSPNGIDVEYALRFRFQASNNEAKYEAVIDGLNLTHSMEADQLEVSSDSQLIVKQIEDSYEARGEKMNLYPKKVRELLKKFIRVQVKHVPRTENSRADALEKLATASQEDLGRLIPIEYLLEPSVSIDNGEVSPMMSEPSWMDPIWDYLVEGTLPSDPKEAFKLRARSARFTIHRGTLYK